MTTWLLHTEKGGYMWRTK